VEGSLEIGFEVAEHRGVDVKEAYQDYVHIEDLLGYTGKFSHGGLQT